MIRPIRILFRPQRQQGEISVKSTVGTGSQCTERLPVRCEQENRNGSVF
jgi:hypothetical protein